MKLTRRVLVGGFLAAPLLTKPAGAQDWLSIFNGLGTLGNGNSGSGLSAVEVARGLKEALQVGSQNTISKVGRVNGYFNDPQIHVPLPDTYKTAQSTLRVVGMSGMLDDLELKLNRGAEIAASNTLDLFWDAITRMTISDALGILNGPDDSATKYFRRTMGNDLGTRMYPYVDSALQEAGAVRAYENVVNDYRAAAFAPSLRQNLTQFVLEKGIDGIFHYIGEEEKAIRHNPAARTTDLLRRVFG